MPTTSMLPPNELDKAIFSWVQELIPEGICVTDNELRIQFWNRWLEAKSGLSKEKVIGRTLPEVFPDLETRRICPYFEKALAGEVSVLSVALHRYLFPFPSPIQNAFPHMLQTARIAPLTRIGKLVGTITTIEDVTEREHKSATLRKQHERQELFSWALAHLLQSPNPEVMVKEIFPRISDHIDVDIYANYLLEPDGKLHLHSSGGLPAQAQEEFATIELGKELTGICALEQRSIVTCNIQQSDDPTVQAARKLGIRATVCHPLLVDNSLIGTLNFASRTRDQFDPDEVEFTRTVAQYVAIAIERSRTLSALHDARTELGHHAESLETKVSQRTAELKQTVQALEGFSYTLAHDVRAPLRHIQGFAHALLEDCGPELSEKAQEYVGLILRGTKRLDALTNDILAYGQVSNESSAKTAIDLEALLHEIISNHPGLKSQGTVTIQQPLHKPFAERILLEQCLTNLLDNALKFVPAGATPRINVHTEYKPESVRISIEDNGIGIPQEFQDKIFGVFERLPTEQAYEGTGIGLAIVAKATQQMGGRVGVESRESGGSRFWLELPAAQR